MAQSDDDLSRRGSAPDPGSPDIAVRWSQSDSHTIHPTFFDASATRQEVALLFGRERTDDPANLERTIDLTDRIIVSPFVAKKIAAALNTVLGDYEAKYGPPGPERTAKTADEEKEVTALVPQDILGQNESRTESLHPAGGSPNERRPVNSTVGPLMGNVVSKAGLLFQVVNLLRVEAGFEQSFKISQGTLLTNRFLLGVSKGWIGSSPDDRILNMCSRLGMPASLLGTFRRYLPHANYVHWGFEQGTHTAVYKVYLEFWDNIKRRISESHGHFTPMLLHAGFKWDVSNNRSVAITRYVWHPRLTSTEILERVSTLLGPAENNAALCAVEDLLGAALARVQGDDILYLEVTEEGNPRRSFDINVYRAGLQVAEVYPILSTLCRLHSLAYSDFHSLYDVIKSKRFGHLAGGIDRQGRNFFTVYYGVEAVFGEGGPRKESPSGESAIAPSRYAAPSRQRRMSRVEQTDDRAAHLFWAVKDLDMRVALEHSFKFLEKTLLSDRLLVGVQQPGDANRRDAILEVCRELAMPEDFQQKFRVQLPNANTILFGFEKSDTRSVYKTYLEFSDRLTEALQKDPKPESVVLHEGFKWDASDNTKKMMAEYRTFLFSEAREMALRISESFYAKSETNAFRIVDDVIDLAGSRTATGELLYFEVTEESNPRRSFDVNLYRANLRMEEVYPLLVAAARHYSVELDRFDALYEDVRTQIFGHLSGGTDRQGRDFLTVYFSEKGSSRAPHGLP